MEQRTIVEKKAEVVEHHDALPPQYVGNTMAPVGDYPANPVIHDHRDDVHLDHATGKPKKQGFGAKVKAMFGGKKAKKAARQGHHGGVVVDEHVHTKTTTTTTTLDQGAGYVQGHQHQHGPLVANPYAQPAHGQIFVPANTAVLANPETGALLPASNLNGPVVLPTGPNMIPIATNYPAGQAGPMVIPPSGGFINNSGNPYLTQQSYGPAGVIPGQNTTVETHVHDREFVDSKAVARMEKEELKHQKVLEKEEARRMKEYEKEQKRVEKEEMNRQKTLEKEAAAAHKSELKLQQQIEKDQEKLEKQRMKDQEKLAKDENRLATTIAKDEAAIANNQMKLQNKLDKTEAKLEQKVAEDQMKVQNTLSKEIVAPAPYTTAAPIHNTLDVGGHGVKHVLQEETKQDAFTGEVLAHNVYHKDTRF